MRKLLLSAAAMTLLFTACKKKDDNGTGNGLGKNQWKVGGTTYNSVAVQGAGGMLVASGTNGSTQGSSFTVTFDDALPTAGGTYKIVDIASLDAADEVYISVATTDGVGGAGKAYASAASNTATATVTVDGGKITVSVPEITVSGSASGSTTFSGNITQN